MWAAPTERAPGVGAPPAPGGPARRTPLWVIAAVAVVLVALGVGVGLVIPILNRPADDSPEAGFARDMSAHHAQAVEMGMIAYARASDERVRFLGRDIALTQQGQIGMMQGWLSEWGLNPTGSEPPMAWMPEGAASIRDGLMPGMATQAQVEQLRTATGKDEDILFIKLMQQHHLGGIHMAEAAEKLSTDSAVDALARLDIDGQQRELTDLANLLKELQN